MHDQSKSLFVEALAIPIDEREAFLQEACRGDESLRAEVGSLLHHHDQLALKDSDRREDRGSLRQTLHSVVRSWVDRDRDGTGPPEVAPPSGDSAGNPPVD